MDSEYSENGRGLKRNSISIERRFCYISKKTNEEDTFKVVLIFSNSVQDAIGGDMILVFNVMGK